MKPIAIHNGSGWNQKWVEFCKQNSLPHKVVCCYDSDIIEQVRECSSLMWHFHHVRPQDILMARNVLNAAELMGLKVFPDFKTNWHFDDKLSQKYLCEALGLPLAQTWAFFDIDSAMAFVENCELPIVAKLRRGAGSYNVRLLKTRLQTHSYVKRMFGKGFSPAPAPLADVKTKFMVAASHGGFTGVMRRLKKAPNFFKVMLNARKYFGNEKGYAYFQKFIPGNICDYRLKVVGERTWGFRRFVRKNDFRASGSGELDFDYNKIPLSMVMMAFEAARKLETQSLALDIVMDNDKPLIVEMSYGFGIDEGEAGGYWTEDGVRHNEPFDPKIAIFKTFLKSHQSSS